MKTPFDVSAFRARPMSVAAILITVVAMGSAVLAGCGGGSSEPSSSSSSTPESGTTSSTPTPSPTPEGGTTAATLDGAQIYAQRCVLCHGPEGKGDGPAAASLNPKPRNHTDGSYMNARTDEELLTVIRGGKGAMPAWQSVLSEDEMHAVLKHIRSLAVPPYPG